MLSQISHSSQSDDDEDIIVWIPFVTKKKHLKSPLTPAAEPQPNGQHPIPLLPQQVKPKPQRIPQEPTPSAYTTSSRVRMDKTHQRKGLASDKQKDFVRKLAGQQNMTEADVCSEVGASSIDEMSNSEANEFISKHKDARPRHYDNQSFF